MSKPFGTKQGPMKQSAASTAQRQNAWAKALEGMPVVEDDSIRKVGENKKVIKDGYQKLNVIKKNVDCETCEVRNVCKDREKVLSDGLKNCPLYPIYRDAIVDVMQQPLMHLSKTAARLEVAIQKQSMLDREEGVPISKIMIQATKVSLEAVKIAQASEKGVSKRGRRVVGDTDEVVIEADCFEVE